MNPIPEQTDQKWIAELRSQESGAFTELVRSNEPLIVGLCRAMGLRGMDMEDAVAEAFAEVYRALPGYEGRSSIKTWVYRIAYRVIVRLRTERRKSRHSDFNEVARADKSASPAEAVQTQDESERLWSAVARLEPRQAAAVELYYRRDFSIEEIAELLACPSGTIKTLLHRARALLREALQGELMS